MLRRGRAGLGRRVRPGAGAAGQGDRAGRARPPRSACSAARCTPPPTSTRAPAGWSPRTPRGTRRWPSRRPSATTSGGTSPWAAWPTSRARRAGRRTVAGTPRRPSRWPAAWTSTIRARSGRHSGCSSSGWATRTPAIVHLEPVNRAAAPASSPSAARPARTSWRPTCAPDGRCRTACTGSWSPSAPTTRFPGLAALCWRCRGHAWPRTPRSTSASPPRSRCTERTDNPFALARTWLCHGERLRRAGRRAEARDRLVAAADLFDRLGARRG